MQVQQQKACRHTWIMHAGRKGEHIDICIVNFGLQLYVVLHLVYMSFEQLQQIDASNQRIEILS